jgi:hypothetical protein
MPAERPTRFQLVANLKAAKALGIELPTSILLRADEVIEIRHPAASSVSRWLTICLRWLLLQQMHCHCSESRVIPLRGFELF